MSRGRFLTFEGGEGSGKSTQVGRLTDRLRGLGIDTLQTREPGGTPGADEIRRLLTEGGTNRWHPISELLLHFAARHDHMVRTIEPALAAGSWVVCDRFADSTMAYQGFGHRLGSELVKSVQAAAIGDFRPDLTLLLDVPVDLGLSRARDRGSVVSDRYERMDETFHDRVRSGFLAIARAELERVAVLDATAPADDVAAVVWRVVARKFGLGDG